MTSKPKPKRSWCRYVHQNDFVAFQDWDQPALASRETAAAIARRLEQDAWRHK